jgi:hypothetical protein
MLDQLGAPGGNRVLSVAHLRIISPTHRVVFRPSCREALWSPEGQITEPNAGRFHGAEGTKCPAELARAVWQPIGPSSTHITTMPCLAGSIEENRVPTPMMLRAGSAGIGQALKMCYISRHHHRHCIVV